MDMMAALFFIYVISLILMLLKKKTLAFCVFVLNLILCWIMLLHHTTDIFEIFL